MAMPCCAGGPQRHQVQEHTAHQGRSSGKDCRCGHVTHIGIDGLHSERTHAVHLALCRTRADQRQQACMLYQGDLYPNQGGGAGVLRDGFGVSQSLISTYQVYIYIYIYIYICIYASLFSTGK